MLAQRFTSARLVFICDRNVISARARALGSALELPEFDPCRAANEGSGRASVLHSDVAAAVLPGELNAANAGYVLGTLDAAIDGCLSGAFHAVVTGPVQKSIINQSGIPFSGHTEYFAQRCGVQRVVMMLVGGGLRVALTTTHLALKDVPAAITPLALTETLRVLHNDLLRRFKIARPRILVAGLNPHAGEGGYLGREEIDVIEPVLQALRSEGMNLIGPLPADTLFTPQHLERSDCVLAMYHDQGLPVLKMRSFGHGVNVTLGLPIIRTSVDHGTALDLAGTGKIDPGSMVAAVELAIHLAQA
jgi:4-hydroxythreonine-4-phosphate dehydrogenase